jgi:predicted RND superfamily exporter protein
MADKLLTRLQEIALVRPVAVLAVMLAACLFAGGLGLGLEIRTSRSELVPDDDVNQARWDALRADFTDPQPLIIAIEGSDDVTQLEAIVDEFATALRGRPEIGATFHRVDLDWLGDHVLHLAPPEQMQTAIAEIDAALAGPDGRIEIHSFAALNERLAERIEAALATGAVLPSNDGPAESRLFTEYLRAQQEFVRDPLDWVAALDANPLSLVDPGDRGSVTANGYLSTRDEKVLFLLATLAGDANAGLERQQRVVDVVRALAAEIVDRHAGIQIGLTGTPAMDVEEMATISRDGRRTSVIALTGVFLLSLLAFHSRFHALLGLVTLAVGVVLAIGAVRLEVGYLNMITTALIPILVGMGIDYAVHPISQYEIERRLLERGAAVRATLRKTSRPVVVSALTTSAAFFSFLFMRFKGFSELGLVTGIGVLLCLLAASFALPALLMLFGGGHREGRSAVVDDLWDEAAAGALCRTPRATVAIAAFLVLLCIPAATRVGINPSLLELLPPGAESLHYLRVMNERSGLRSDVNLVVADDLDSLRAMAERAATLPTVERFESLLSFVPSRPEASRIAVERAREMLDRTNVRGAVSTTAGLRESLSRLELALSDAADAAFVTGLGEVAAELDTARGIAAELGGDLLATGADGHAARARAEAQLQDKVAAIIAELRHGATVAFPSPASLPEDLRQRFVTSGGQYVGYVYPAGDIYDADFLEAFNADAATVSGTSIGFPVIFEDHSKLITAGFGTAFGVGGLLVIVFLLLDLRRPGEVFLAAVPVLVGAAWMLGLMALLGLSFNFANLIAVPIVLGVGIDAGVHLVHRYRLEGDEGMTVGLAHTGRAILVASLTTMVGFGSLALASHRGMASLGVLLVLGVGSCLVAALVVLPNLILALGLTRR